MRVPIVTSYDGRGVRQAEKGFNSLISRSLAAKLSIAAVGGALVKLGKDSVRAAMEDEAGFAKLSKTLSNSGFGKYAESVNESIGAMQAAYGTSEELLRPSFVSLFNATKDVAGSQGLLQTALDVSAGVSKDLSTVVSALSKAMAGNRKGLIALGTGLDSTYLKTASLSDIVAQLSTQFAGQASTAADTYSGKWDRLNKSFGEAKEKIGYSLIEAFASLATSGGNSLDELQAKIDKVANGIARIINGIAQIGRNANASKTVNVMALVDQSGLNWTNGGPANITAPDNAGNARKTVVANQIQQLQWQARAAALEKEYKKKKKLQDQAAAAAKAAKAAEAAAKKADAAAAARAKAANAEKAKADKARIKAAEKELRLKKLAAKFDLDLIGIAAAKKRTGNATDLARLNALDVLAQDAAGLQVSDAALSAAEKGMTTNVTVNVTGSVITEQELASSISAQILAQRIRTGTLTGSPGEFRQFEMMTR